MSLPFAECFHYLAPSSHHLLQIVATPNAINATSAPSIAPISTATAQSVRPTGTQSPLRVVGKLPGSTMTFSTSKNVDRFEWRSLAFTLAYIDRMASLLSNLMTQSFHLLFPNAALEPSLLSQSTFKPAETTPATPSVQHETQSKSVTMFLGWGRELHSLF